MCSSKKRNGGFFPPSTTLFFHSFFLIVFCLFALFELGFLVFFSIQRLLVPRWGRGGRFVWLMKAFWGKQVDFYFVCCFCCCCCCVALVGAPQVPTMSASSGGVTGASPVSVHPFCSSPSFLFSPRRVFKFHPDSFHPQPYLWLRPRLPSFCSFSPCFLSRRE